jgi:cytoskeletal protein CcmA (bactofilin family)
MSDQRGATAANPPKAATPRPVDSNPESHRPPPLLHAGSGFDGVVLLPRPARIDGRVRGRVLGEQSVWIGATAIVEGDVEADSVVVEGVVEGSVRARERITLAATARVTGAIRAPRVALAEGAWVQGTCRSGEAVRPALEPSPGVPLSP